MKSFKTSNVCARAARGLATGIALLASVRFSRFDPARETRKIPEAPPSEVLEVKEVYIYAVVPLKEVQLRPLGEEALQFRFGPMLVAECRLILKDLKEFPFLGMGGSAAAGASIIAGLLLPLDAAQGILLPVAWLLPVLIWSKLGTREARHQTEQLVCARAPSAGPYGRGTLWPARGGNGTILGS